MGKLTFADRTNTTERTLKWYIEHRVELTRKGINADYWIAQMRASLDNVIGADQFQESQKASLRNSTIAFNQADKANYMLTSGAIDAAAGAYGKSTPDAMTLKRFRSKLHRPVPTPVPSA